MCNSHQIRRETMPRKETIDTLSAPHARDFSRGSGNSCSIECSHTRNKKEEMKAENFDPRVPSSWFSANRLHRSQAFLSRAERHQTASNGMFIPHAVLRALRSQQIEARDHERETNTRLRYDSETAVQKSYL